MGVPFVVSGISGVRTIEKVCGTEVWNGSALLASTRSFPDWQRGCVPVYEEVKGWDEDISMVKDVNDLPPNAQKYLKRIEQLTGVEICMLSLGNERSQTVMLKNPFYDA